MAVLTAEKIRLRLKDTPAANILLRGELQNEDELIAEAMEFVVDMYNITPPIIENVTITNFPNNALMFLGVVWQLAAGEAERQLRNNVNYSAQGLNAGIDDKFQLYNQLAEQYRIQFMTAVGPVKQAVNMSNAWGEVLSPYSAIEDVGFRQ